MVNTTGLCWWTNGRSVRGVVSLREDGSAITNRFLYLTDIILLTFDCDLDDGR